MRQSLAGQRGGIELECKACFARGCEVKRRQERPGAVSPALSFLSLPARAAPIAVATSAPAR